MVGTQHGYDLNPAGAKYSHTHLGARYLIFKHVTQGYTCYSEHAIIHNRCPVGTDDLVRALGKIPDGLLLSHVPGAPPRIFALETEVAYKAPTIVSRQLGMLSHLGLKLRSDLPHIFSGLIVLMPAEMEWHVQRLVNVARRRWAQRPRPQDLADHVLIARADLGASWSFKGANESKLLL
jgi:hypothetical protein